MPTPVIGDRYGDRVVSTDSAPVLVSEYEIVGVCPKTILVVCGSWRCAQLLPRTRLDAADLCGKGTWHETAVTLGDFWRRPTGDTVQIVCLVGIPTRSEPDTAEYLVPRTGDIRTIGLHRMYEENWVRVGPGWGSGKHPDPAPGQRWRLETGVVVELVSMGTSLGHVSGPGQVPIVFDPNTGVYLGRQTRWRRSAVIPGTTWCSNKMCVTVQSGTSLDIGLRNDGGWDFTMTLEEFRKHFRPEVQGPVRSRYDVLLEGDDADQ